MGWKGWTILTRTYHTFPHSKMLSHLLPNFQIYVFPLQSFCSQQHLFTRRNGSWIIVNTPWQSSIAEILMMSWKQRWYLKKSKVIGPRQIRLIYNSGLTSLREVNKQIGLFVTWKGWMMSAYELTSHIRCGKVCRKSTSQWVRHLVILVIGLMLFGPVTLVYFRKWAYFHSSDKF